VSRWQSGKLVGAVGGTDLPSQVLSRSPCFRACRWFEVDQTLVAEAPAFGRMHVQESSGEVRHSRGHAEVDCACGPKSGGISAAKACIVAPSSSIAGSDLRPVARCVRNRAAASGSLCWSVIFKQSIAFSLPCLDGQAPEDSHVNSSWHEAPWLCYPHVATDCKLIGWQKGTAEGWSHRDVTPASIGGFVVWLIRSQAAVEEAATGGRRLASNGWETRIGSKTGL